MDKFTEINTIPVRKTMISSTFSLDQVFNGAIVNRALQGPSRYNIYCTWSSRYNIYCIWSSRYNIYCTWSSRYNIYRTWSSWYNIYFICIQFYLRVRLLITRVESTQPVLFNKSSLARSQCMLSSLEGSRKITFTVPFISYYYHASNTCSLTFSFLHCCWIHF